MRKFKENLLIQMREDENITIRGFRPNPRSISSMSPGDLLIFTYNEVSRFVLVISCARGRGTFLSSKRNILVSCIQLNLTSPSSSIILRALYKNVKGADYQRLNRSLHSLFGRSNFRTFQLTKMKQIDEVVLET